MGKNGNIFIGIDVGSTTVKVVALDGRCSLIQGFYTPCEGRPLQVVRDDLVELFKRVSKESVKGVGVTGSGGNFTASILNVRHENELIAQTRAISKFYSEAKTVIEMGGQDAKLLLLKKDPHGSGIMLTDFEMNSLCAAGTGSFLDQQASRLGFTIEEFAEVALHSEVPARISGRCSVFAKSDMIHLQQVGLPKKDIVAGLCFAMARNFKSTLAKGKKLETPVLFQGGVAANAGMVHAFRKTLELSDKELVVPDEHKFMSAIGAALLAQEGSKNEDKNGDSPPMGTVPIFALDEFLKSATKKRATLEPLIKPDEGVKGVKGVEGVKGKGKSPDTPDPLDSLDTLDVYVGVDVGSVTTKAAIIDKDGKLLRGIYLKTQGDPITAVKEALRQAGEGIADRLNVLGAGTTGSGRILIGDFIGADTVRNEITTQAAASMHIDPEVDTIFEIGGQDSKYISIDNGVVVDFEMNKACAAGTGSFLEEQALKLGIDIAKDFSGLAFSSQAPCPLGERCTVFMESDLVSHQQQGAEKDELVAGLAYSITYNYLNKVVADRRVGERIFFQGGVAFNKAVMAAFEKVLKKRIIVPPHHEVTGAIGAALVAMEEKRERSAFRGFDLSSRKYAIKTFECKGCPNRCEINKVTLDDKDFYYGARCERYDAKVAKETKESIPELFKERDINLMAESVAPARTNGLKIGIPRSLYFYELAPFWNTFFRNLGFEVVISDITNPKLVREATERAVCETCFPIKLAHGHVANLLEKDVQYLFMPNLINYEVMPYEFDEDYHCPYVQASPNIIKSALDEGEFKGAKILQPKVYITKDRSRLEKVFIELGKELDRSEREVLGALARARAAQLNMTSESRKRGREVLEHLGPDEMACVLVSRPYNGCDPGLNLGIPKKLKDLGVTAIPMDFLELDSIDISKEFSNMFWCSGQRILSAAKIIRGDPRLYAIYITNFGCGPDAFIVHFFRSIMAGKPYLQIEIDEHSGDAGILTRCEAFLDSLRKKKVKAKSQITNSKFQTNSNSEITNYKLPVIQDREERP